MSNEASRAPLPVLVRLPVLFASLFPTAERRVELFVESVDELIDALDARWPGMRDRLCDSTPAIRRHIRGQTRPPRHALGAGYGRLHRDRDQRGIALNPRAGVQNGGDRRRSPR